MKKQLRWVVLVLLGSVVLGLGAHRAAAEGMVPLQHVGNATYDPNTGLEWLDLSLTAGQSYASVLNGWNGYTTTLGFRFATRSEVLQLFADAGAAYIGYPPSPSTADLPSASLVLSLLGTTFPQAEESRSWMFYAPSTEPTLPTSAYVPAAVFGVDTLYAGYPAEGFFMVPGIFPLQDYSSPEMASALVKVVPEPSAALCLTIGLGLSLLVAGSAKRRGRRVEDQGSLTPRR